MNAKSPDTLNHTPGPWHLGGRNNAIVYAQDGYAVANAETYHGEHGGAFESNARLIAAAPELLEALRDALAALLYPVTHESSRAAIATKAYATIAKVEGREVANG